MRSSRSRVEGLFSGVRRDDSDVSRSLMESWVERSVGERSFGYFGWTNRPEYLCEVQH